MGVGIGVGVGGGGDEVHCGFGLSVLPCTLGLVRFGRGLVLAVEIVRCFYSPLLDSPRLDSISGPWMLYYEWMVMERIR